MTRTKWLNIACIRRQHFITIGIEKFFSNMLKGKVGVLNLKLRQPNNRPHYALLPD